MGRLIRYKASWSRVDLTNGDPVFISVAQSGVIVKKSRFGFMGSKLYEEINIYKAAQVAEALNMHFGEYQVPSEMTNPVLRALTQTALQCESAAELSVRLNRALEEEAHYSALDENRRGVNKRNQIVSDYGIYLENNPLAGEIRDVSELPHPKNEILDAITREIAEEDDRQRREALKAAAFLLADFQEGVGSKPLTALGLSHSEMSDVKTMNNDERKKFLTKMSNYAEKEKYASFKEKADKEINEIRAKLLTAEEVNNKM